MFKKFVFILFLDKMLGIAPQDITIFSFSHPPCYISIRAIEYPFCNRCKPDLTSKPFYLSYYILIRKVMGPEIYLRSHYFSNQLPHHYKNLLSPPLLQISHPR